MSEKRITKIIIKFIAYILTVTFLLQDVAWALPDRVSTTSAQADKLAPLLFLKDPRSPAKVAEKTAKITNTKNDLRGKRDPGYAHPNFNTAVHDFAIADAYRTAHCTNGGKCKYAYYHTLAPIYRGGIAVDIGSSDSLQLSFALLASGARKVFTVDNSFDANGTHAIIRGIERLNDNAFNMLSLRDGACDIAFIHNALRSILGPNPEILIAEDMIGPEFTDNPEELKRGYNEKFSKLIREALRIIKKEGFLIISISKEEFRGLGEDAQKANGWHDYYIKWVLGELDKMGLGYETTVNNGETYIKISNGLSNTVGRHWVRSAIVVINNAVNSMTALFAIVVFVAGCVGIGPFDVQKQVVGPIPARLRSITEYPADPHVMSDASGYIFGFEGLFSSNIHNYIGWLSNSRMKNMQYVMPVDDMDEAVKVAGMLNSPDRGRAELTTMISYSCSDSFFGIGGKNSFAKKLDEKGIPIDAMVMFDDNWPASRVPKNVKYVINVRQRSALGGKAITADRLEGGDTVCIDICIDGISHLDFPLTPHEADTSAERAAINEYTSLIIKTLDYIHRQKKESLDKRDKPARQQSMLDMLKHEYPGHISMEDEGNVIRISSEYPDLAYTGTERLPGVFHSLFPLALIGAFVSTFNRMHARRDPGAGSQDESTSSYDTTEEEITPAQEASELVRRGNEKINRPGENIDQTGFLDLENAFMHSAVSERQRMDIMLLLMCHMHPPFEGSEERESTKKNREYAMEVVEELLSMDWPYSSDPGIFDIYSTVLDAARPMTTIMKGKAYAAQYRKDVLACLARAMRRSELFRNYVAEYSKSDDPDKRNFGEELLASYKELPVIPAIAVKSDAESSPPAGDAADEAPGSKKELSDDEALQNIHELCERLLPLCCRLEDEVIAVVNSGKNLTLADVEKLYSAIRDVGHVGSKWGNELCSKYSLDSSKDFDNVVKHEIHTRDIYGGVKAIERAISNGRNLDLEIDYLWNSFISYSKKIGRLAALKKYSLQSDLRKIVFDEGIGDIELFSAVSDEPKRVVKYSVDIMNDPDIRYSFERGRWVIAPPKSREEDSELNILAFRLAGLRRSETFKLLPLTSEPNALNGKTLVLYADSVLENGAIADLECMLHWTRALNQCSFIVYGKKPNSAELLKKIITGANQSVFVETVEPALLADKYSNPSINTERPDEAKELEYIIRFANAHGYRDDKLVGVIKGVTCEDYKDESKRIAKELHAPVVSFDSNEGFYSFTEALRDMIAAKAKNSINPDDWFIELAPVKKLSEDMLRAYEDYRRALNIAINA